MTVTPERPSSGMPRKRQRILTGSLQHINSKKGGGNGKHFDASVSVFLSLPLFLKLPLIRAQCATRVGMFFVLSDMMLIKKITVLQVELHVAQTFKEVLNISVS